MTAVRYFSKGGNTKTIAEAIAEGAKVKAVSVTDENELKEHIDILFLGGAPYTGVMAAELKDYAQRLTGEKVGKVVLFSTSNLSKRTIKGLRKIISEKGIEVAEDYFHASSFRIDKEIDNAKQFGATHNK